MNKLDVRNCPECLDPESVSRRGFMRGMAATGASLWAAPLLAQTPAQTPAPAAQPAAKPPHPAEDLIRELYTGLSNEQKQGVVYAWNHGAAGNTPAQRLRTYNAAPGRRVGQVYTRPQQELVGRIVRSMMSDDESYARITRVLDSDTNGGLGGAGADIFGDPTNQRPFAFVLTAHHLTLRCDGNSEPDTAFGGPIYYGHSPAGTNERNAFNFQTRAVRTLYDALSEDQKRRGRIVGNPGETLTSVRFRPAAEARPGIAASELTADMRRLVETTMTAILAPFRREDSTEVMDILRRNGGLERLNFAFYLERPNDTEYQWHFWRIEGPGFVWNYRIMPHVHTWVNIAARA